MNFMCVEFLGQGERVSITLAHSCLLALFHFRLYDSHNFEMPNGFKHWCFTINNPTADDEALLTNLHDEGVVEYIVFGREVGDVEATPHLQGYATFVSRRSFQFVQRHFPAGTHIENRRGSGAEAIDYCKKDGDFVELGAPPVEQGHRSDIDRYKAWLISLPGPPSEREIASEFTALYLRYSRQCINLSKLLCTPVVLEEDPARPWQQALLDVVAEPAPKREILFYVDPAGGAGKSWMMRKLFSVCPNDVQVLGLGKRADIAHAVDETRSIFVFDIPRQGMEFLCYDLLEKLKDRVVFSPKYDSKTKILKVVPHVIVFANEMPDMNKMTPDRYVVMNDFFNVNL